MADEFTGILHQKGTGIIQPALYRDQPTSAA